MRISFVEYYGISNYNDEHLINTSVSQCHPSDAWTSSWGSCGMNRCGLSSCHSCPCLCLHVDFSSPGSGAYSSSEICGIV